MNSCKHLKSETHLRNAQVNKVSSVNKGIVKICLVVDMVRKNWSWIVVADCGLHYFVSARFGSFWVFAKFSTAKRFKYLFFRPSYENSYHGAYSLFRLTSLIYAEKFEFENPAIMEDKQCKQTERFSVMTIGRDYFLS